MGDSLGFVVITYDTGYKPFVGFLHPGRGEADSAAAAMSTTRGERHVVAEVFEAAAPSAPSAGTGETP